MYHKINLLPLKFHWVSSHLSFENQPCKTLAQNPQNLHFYPNIVPSKQSIDIQGYLHIYVENGIYVLQLQILQI